MFMISIIEGAIEGFRNEINCIPPIRYKKASTLLWVYYIAVQVETITTARELT